MTAFSSGLSSTPQLDVLMPHLITRRWQALASQPLMLPILSRPSALTIKPLPLSQMSTRLAQSLPMASVMVFTTSLYEPMTIVSWHILPLKQD